jgi:hypothetical protein
VCKLVPFLIDTGSNKTYLPKHAFKQFGVTNPEEQITGAILIGHAQRRTTSFRRHNILNMP